MMRLHLGIEDMEPRNWVAWVFELPGCYARAVTRQEAIAAVPAAVNELLERLKPSNLAMSDPHPPFEFEISEEWKAYNSSPDYIVNAFFDNDKLPLQLSDIEYALRLLHVNRSELLALASNLSQTELTRAVTGEVQGNILGILTHIGTAEWWYWDRLALAFPRAERPTEWRELLQVVRGFTNRHLPELVGSDLITERSEERWSPRKLVRRAIWHERVHTLQIARYLQIR